MDNIIVKVLDDHELATYKTCLANLPQLTLDQVTLSKIPIFFNNSNVKCSEQLNNQLTPTVDTNLIDESLLESDDFNLDEFVDIVTTYKCKFCDFSCAWKTDLVSHIKELHIKKTKVNENFNQLNESSTFVAANSTEVQNSGIQVFTEFSRITEGQTNPIANDNSLSVINLNPENQTYLCGQCNSAFNGLDACKKHLTEQHQISLNNSIPPLLQLNKTKRKPKKKKQFYDTECSPKSKKDKVVAIKEYTEPLSKRKVRPPRALCEDYLLSRKRKYIRRQDPQEKQFRCQNGNCGQHFSTEANLDIHSRCHTSDEQSFECIECHEKIEHWRVMTMHLWRSHQIDLDLFACHDCNYRSYSSFKLENHQRIHSAERNFKCNICDKGFKQISQLRNHKVIHIDRKSMTERRWFSEQKCDICNRSFSDTKCLRKHMQAVHNKLKPFVCNFCDHTSARKAMLQLHLRQHTGEKPFQCELCEYRTGDHNSLRRHKMRHSGVKKYKCQHCPYACIQAISYKTHMKNKHPGMEGLFCCQLCSFRSVSNENYTNHMADHKRGVLPLKNGTNATNNTSSSNNSNNGSPSNVNSDAELAPSPVITNMEQLQNILPKNSETTQLIYSCLNALGSGTLPPGVTTSNNGSTQTITIQIPNEGSEDDRDGHIYLTIDQPLNLSTDINAYPNAGIGMDGDDIIDYGLGTPDMSKDGTVTAPLDKVSMLTRDLFSTVNDNSLHLNSSLQILRTPS